MRGQFLRNIALLLGINLLIKPVYIFGIDRTMQNHVGTETWGWYATLLSFCYLFQVVNDFGIQSFNTRHISQHRQLLAKHFPGLLTIKTLFALLFLGVVHLAGMWAGYAPGWLFFAIAVNLVLTSLLLFLRSNIAGLGFYRNDSLLSAADKLIMIAVVGAVLLTPHLREGWTILHFALAQTFSLLLAIAMAVGLLWRHLQWRPFRLNPAFMRLALRQMAPFALVTFLMVLYTRLDMVMLEKLLPDGAHQAGIYAAGFRLLDAANNVGFLAAGLLLPMFARMLKTGEAIAPLLLTAFRILFPLALIGAGLMFFYGGPVMMLLHAPNADAYWGSVAGIVFSSFIAISLMYLFGSLLSAAGRLGPMNRIFAVGVVANVALNFWLIPEHQALGAAWASLVTQSGVAIALVWLSASSLNVAVPGAWWWRALVFGVLTWATSWALAGWMDSWLGAFFTSGIMGIVWAIGLKLFDFSAIAHQFERFRR
jgi:O-antigen/teichoic acid export membrane protein